VGAVTANLPDDLPNELFTTLVDAADVCIERLVSHGHVSPEGGSGTTRTGTSESWC
jgi:hypothetical protein